MVESSQQGYKTLVTSNFFFSHSVFNRLLLQTRTNQDLFERGLTHYRTTKKKALADDKMIENLKLVLCRVENTVGKENVGSQHFLLFPQCFLKASFSGASKVGRKEGKEGKMDRLVIGWIVKMTDNQEWTDMV